MYDIIIIGGGPAGLTAAIYARRSGKSVLLLEKEGFGGQIAYAPRVENYPGVAALPGAELAERMLTQALELDTDTDIGTVTAIEDHGEEKRVLTEEGESYSCRAVIISTGARHRTLGVPGEEELVGHGISYCAVCDGSFYKGCDVAVVGGGDTALQEALLLSDICRSVTVIHRRESFRGDREKQKKLFARENVRVLTSENVEGFVTERGELSALELRHAVSGEKSRLTVSALFVAVGHLPELGCFAELLPLNEKGYALSDENGNTPAAGIFVAGDCREKQVRQLTTAVSDGAAAALNACCWLEK